MLGGVRNCRRISGILFGIYNMFGVVVRAKNNECVNSPLEMAVIN